MHRPQRCSRILTSKDEATKQLRADIDRLTLDNKNVKDKRDSLEKDLNEKFVEIQILEETVKQNQAAAQEANNARPPAKPRTP